MTETRVDQLRAAARAALARAYAPYSRFRVGAALSGVDGQIHVGCNVENASFSASICAERAAVLAAVAGGTRSFDMLVIASEAGEPTPPCGTCRQVLVEFAPRLDILGVTANGRERRWNLGDLLREPFTPELLSGG